MRYDQIENQERLRRSLLNSYEILIHLKWHYCNFCAAWNGRWRRIGNWSSSVRFTWYIVTVKGEKLVMHENDFDATYDIQFIKRRRDKWINSSHIMHEMCRWCDCAIRNKLCVRIMLVTTFFFRLENKFNVSLFLGVWIIRLADNVIKEINISSSPGDKFVSSSECASYPARLRCALWWKCASCYNVITSFLCHTTVEAWGGQAGSVTFMLIYVGIKFWLTGT